MSVEITLRDAIVGASTNAAGRIYPGFMPQVDQAFPLIVY
jgi:hypothetical protein